MKLKNGIALVLLTALLTSFSANAKITSFLSGGLIDDNGDVNVNAIIPGASEEVNIVNILFPGPSLLSDDEIYNIIATSLPGISAQDISNEIDNINDTLGTIRGLGLEYMGSDLVTDAVLYKAYREYMKPIANNSTPVFLSSNFISSYKTQYENRIGVPIENISFYTSSNVPQNGSSNGAGITDCNKIYFTEPVAGIPSPVNILTGAIGNNNTLELLLHEIAHVKQCNDLGGRKNYGIYWTQSWLSATGIFIGSGAETFLSVLGNIDWSNIDNDPAGSFHDALPGEQNADECAIELTSNSNYVCSGFSTYKTRVLSTLIAVIILN